MEWSGIVLRCAVYATLAPAFGVPLQSLTLPVIGRGPLAILIAGGVASSVAGLLMLTAAMAGTPVWPVDPDMLWMIVAETPVGSAFIVRFIALAVALALLALVRPARLRLILTTMATGIALATLAWTGHGAMDEGARGVVHLSADIIHLLAAGAWTGAIVVLLVAVLPPVRDRNQVRAAADALARFATTGSTLVALLIVTGIANGWAIIGDGGVALLWTSLWGQLLLAKLALFAAMLALAATNRWSLAPAVDAALLSGDHGPAIRRIRVSLAVELTTALAIMALVAWLGTLSPQG